MAKTQTAHQFTRRLQRLVELRYLLHLPAGYSPRRGPRWPLILFLHGSGERGTRPGLVAKHGPPRIVRDRPDFPFVVVSPQCPAGRTWDRLALLALLDDVLDTHRVDPRRVYLTGMSMGGYGAWDLGLSHPDRFAALAPICGGSSLVDILLAERSREAAIRRLPIWAFHGARDDVVPLGESERAVEALRAAGCTRIRLTVYPDAGHDSWTATYANPDLYPWFLDHRRRA